MSWPLEIKLGSGASWHAPRAAACSPAAAWEWWLPAACVTEPGPRRSFTCRAVLLRGEEGLGPFPSRSGAELRERLAHAAKAGQPASKRQAAARGGTGKTEISI